MSMLRTVAGVEGSGRLEHFLVELSVISMKRREREADRIHHDSDRNKKMA